MTAVFNASNQGDIHLKNDCDDDQRHVESGSEGRNMDDNSTHQRTGEETGGGSELIGDPRGTSDCCWIKGWKGYEGSW